MAYRLSFCRLSGWPTQPTRGHHHNRCRSAERTSAGPSARGAVIAGRRRREAGERLESRRSNDEESPEMEHERMAESGKQL